MKKYHNTIATHRCSGSLAQYMSIHYCDPYPDLIKYAGYGWWLLEAEQDYGCDWYLRPICKINTCPFCGNKLENINDMREENV